MTLRFVVVVVYMYMIKSSSSSVFPYCPVVDYRTLIISLSLSVSLPHVLMCFSIKLCLPTTLVIFFSLCNASLFPDANTLRAKSTYIALWCFHRSVLTPTHRAELRLLKWFFLAWYLAPTYLPDPRTNVNVKQPSCIILFFFHFSSYSFSYFYIHLQFRSCCFCPQTSPFL